MSQLIKIPLRKRNGNIRQRGRNVRYLRYPRGQLYDNRNVLGVQTDNRNGYRYHGMFDSGRTDKRRNHIKYQRKCSVYLREYLTKCLRCDKI